MKRLCRTECPEARLCGVCCCMAKYFDLDPTVVRLIIAILIIPGGLSIWAYVIAAIIMPRESRVV